MGFEIFYSRCLEWLQTIGAFALEMFDWLFTPIQIEYLKDGAVQIWTIIPALTLLTSGFLTFLIVRLILSINS